jgi:hypothetical protein
MRCSPQPEIKEAARARHSKININFFTVSPPSKQVYSTMFYAIMKDKGFGKRCREYFV